MSIGPRGFAFGGLLFVLLFVLLCLLLCSIFRTAKAFVKLINQVWGVRL